jgi:hypothetical protein
MWINVAHRGDILTTSHDVETLTWPGFQLGDPPKARQSVSPSAWLTEVCLGMALCV